MNFALRLAAFSLGLTAALGAGVAALPARAQDVEKPLKLKNAPRLDVVFLIDTTGSMGDEIDVVKGKLRDMITEIARGTPRPDVRFGLVAYKDRGDVYVTKPSPLTRDIDKIHDEIMALTASGGGDEPEDVQAALVEAIDHMNWDMTKGVARMMFLVGDAGPHNYPGEPSMDQLAVRAEEKAIRVTSIGCSGLNAFAEASFRGISEKTGGRFDFLTYRGTAVASDGTRSTVVTRAGVTYKAKRELREEEWKAGADKLASTGLAEPVAAAPAAAPAEMASAGGRGRADAKPAVPAKGAAFAADVAPVTAGENNLDAVITETIKAEAKKQGVKYTK